MGWGLLSPLLLKGKKKTAAYTSVSSLWGDKKVPYSGSQAIFDYIMQSTTSTSIMGKTLPDYMMDAYNRSLPPKLKRLKRKLDFDPTSYFYGDIESKFNINNEAGVQAYFQTYLDSVVGHTVTLKFLECREINNSHAAWDIFKRLYGYDTTTNEMGTLSAFIGKTVYLKDAQIKYCSDTINRVLDTILLDGIGIGFDFGQTMTRTRDMGKPPTAWIEDTGAVNDHVDMSYTFRVDRTRTKVENLYTSTTISDDTVTDIDPPDPYDSLSTIDLSPVVVNVPTTVKDAPDPLLAPPSTNDATIEEPSLTGLTASTTGGTIAAGTYYCVVSAYNAAGETIVSNEMNVTTTGSTSKIVPVWGVVDGATGYKYWRGTSAGVYGGYYDVGLVTTFDDTNVSLTSSSVPSTNTALIPTPVLSSITGSTTGGSLPADTYFVKITAITASGETGASTEQSVTTTGTTSSITVPIPTIAGATGFKVWRGTETNGQNIHYTIGVVSSFVDDGSVVTPTHSETIRTTTWLSYDDYTCSIDNDFLDYELSGAADETGALDGTSNVIDPNISNTFVPSHTGESSKYFMVQYTYNDGSADQWGYFTYQYGSGGNATLDNIYDTGGIVGDFFPRIYCHLNGERLDTDANKSTDAYKDSVRLCRNLGLSWKSLSKSVHENVGEMGDVKQIAINFAVSANSTHSVDHEYLNKWFHKLWTLLPDVRYQYPHLIFLPDYSHRGLFRTITEYTDIPDSRAGQLVIIKDNVYEQRLDYGGIVSVEINDSIGEIGATSHTVDGTNHTWKLQLTDTVYRQITVYSLICYEVVNGSYMTNASGTSENLLIPLDNSMFTQMSKRKREELYGRSLHIVINTTRVIKVKWYQTTDFRINMYALAVAITIFSAGSASSVSAAIISAVTTAVITVVGTAVIMKLLIALGVDPVIAAVISAIVIAITTGQLDADSLQMTALNLLKLTNVALQLATTAMQEDFKKTMQSMRDFSDYAKGKQDELLEAQKLLASTGYIYDPLHTSSRGNNEYFYSLGESPDAFYARTIATGNIGTAVYAYLASYVDINLQLPSFQSTMNQLNQRAEMA